MPTREVGSKSYISETIANASSVGNLDAMVAATVVVADKGMQDELSKLSRLVAGSDGLDSNAKRWRGT